MDFFKKNIIHITSKTPYSFEKNFYTFTIVNFENNGLITNKTLFDNETVINSQSSIIICLTNNSNDTHDTLLFNSKSIDDDKIFKKFKITPKKYDSIGFDENVFQCDCTVYGSTKSWF